VVAWDANPSALTRCAENLFLNGISHRARFVLGFASSRCGEELDFYTVGTGKAGSRYPGHARTASSRGSVIRTCSLTIDQVAADLDLRPDLVKIDVEGAESDTLEGAVVLAKSQSPPRIMVEMHAPPELPMVENCNRVLAWCAKTRYAAYYLKEHKRIISPDALAHRGRCHLLLLPEGALYPQWLTTIAEYISIETGMAAYQAHKKDASRPPATSALANSG